MSTKITWHSKTVSFVTNKKEPFETELFYTPEKKLTESKPDGLFMANYSKELGQ